MPTISYFRGIKVEIRFKEHDPPHFHAEYGGDEVSVSLPDLTVIAGSMPSKQLRMLLGWAEFHIAELTDNWELAQNKKSPFPIDPLR